MPDSYLLQCSNCGTRNRVPHEKAEARGKCGECGTPLIPSHALPGQVTDADWDTEVFGSRVPAIVEVSAEYEQGLPTLELSNVTASGALNRRRSASFAEWQTLQLPQTAPALTLARLRQTHFIDSADPSISVKEYALSENRYRSLAKTNPEEVEQLMESAQADVLKRWETYQRLANKVTV